MAAATEGLPSFLFGTAANLMASTSSTSSTGMPVAGDDGSSQGGGGGGIQLAMGGAGGGGGGGGASDGRDSTGAESNGGDSSVNPNGAGGNGGSSVALCASCDRCRARKTKCDGARPCGNCAAKYLKKHKLSSIDGVDISEFECVYSPAKRRGPVPGKAGQTRKAGEAGLPGANSALYDQQLALQQQQENQRQLNAFGALGGMGGLPNIGALAGGMDASAELFQRFQLGKNAAATQAQPNLDTQQAQFPGMSLGRQDVADTFGQQQPQHISSMGAQGSGALDIQRLLEQRQATPMAIDTNGTSSAATRGGAANEVAAEMALQHHLSYLHQLQQQQEAQLQQERLRQQQPQLSESVKPQLPTETRSQRPRIAGPSPSSGSKSTSDDTTRIAKHLLLLDHGNAEGNRLRSLYSLSIDELFKLPPIPTDDEYLTRVKNANPGAVSAPHSDLAALRAARFAEIALGALVNNQISLAMELSNATVMCLRECVKDPAHPSCVYDVARGYLLHGIFRSYRGDLERYFKYRRVCLTHVAQLDNVPNVEALIAAISFHDSWAYMLYNATETELPQIDTAIPPVTAKDSKTGQDGAANGSTTSTDPKYGISSDPSQVASNPSNQMWIQGAPPVFINNEANPIHRSIDALACSIRSCCDQANSQFQEMAQKAEGGDSSNSGDGGQTITPTTAAVMANDNELCSRNMVLSAYALLEQHESSSATQGVSKNVGHHMLVSAMDAFLEDGNEEEPGGFTDAQIQSLLSVCNRAVENPLLLFMAGPTYHMVSNAAILLCHLLNGMYSNRVGGDKPGPMEEALFDEILDTFIAVRKLLSIHRRKLPARLRCHSIPRPKVFRTMGMNKDTTSSSSDGSSTELFIDLGDTLMCPCRGCQGFVLMACSPCVAAERAAAAAERNVAIQSGDIPPSEGGVMDIGDFDKELQELGAEFDVADDSLLDVLSRMIST